MKHIDLFSNDHKVSKDNFVEYISEIAQHPDVISAHREWEKLDQEWKDITNDPYSSDAEIIAAATKVRAAREKKDTIFDRVAVLAEKASETVDVIEDYNDNTLGDATAIAEVVELSRDWHEMRRVGIGGSSLSELLGFHWKSHIGYMQYMSDEELNNHWLDTASEKATVVGEVKENTRGVLFRGHKWEPALIVRYALLNDVRVAVTKSTWKGVYDFQIVNFDGIILDKKGNPEGILECKTSSRDWTWQWGVPIHYRCQVLWYLKAAGLKYADVLVKFDSGNFETYRINSDETIDSTDETYQIEHYIPMLEKRWKEVLKYKDNPALLWDTHDTLKEEKSQVSIINNPGDDISEYIDELLSATTALLDVRSPYERMDAKFDRMVAMDVYDGKEVVEYGTSTVSPIFYDTFSLSNRIDAKSLISVLDDDIDTLVAVDTVTYNVMVKKNVANKVINASALRRMVDIAPNREDFSSIKQFHDWLNDKKETNNSSQDDKQ